MVVKLFSPLIALVVFLTMSTTMVFAGDAKLVAYYFHGGARCPTCHKMEQYTKEAIEQNFKEELAAGLVVFKAINTDKKENKYFVNDYQLYTKTLIISSIENGKEIEYKNLTKIWEYVRDKNRFFNYVTTEINTYLKDNQ